MGGGIWSMHFVGMLAFSLPGIEISYDPFLTLLSLVIPIVVAAAAFAVVGRRPQALLASGFAMGLGISSMHYTGMAAMRMAAFMEYDPRWVVVSIVIAISASVVALWLAFRNTSAVQRLFAGFVMGLAISGMHYAAMETIGQLTGGGHDFNNLLAAVLGSLELLEKRLPSGDPKIQRLLNNAMQGAQRGTQLQQASP
jgi:NO-binding membrane sensor protein with MHYT domain